MTLEIKYFYEGYLFQYVQYLGRKFLECQVTMYMYTYIGSEIEYWSDLHGMFVFTSFILNI